MVVVEEEGEEEVVGQAGLAASLVYLLVSFVLVVGPERPFGSSHLCVVGNAVGPFSFHLYIL